MRHSLIDEGWNIYIFPRPRPDLLTEFRFAPDSIFEMDDETVVAYPSEIHSEWETQPGLLWRYTGIAKEQLRRERAERERLWELNWSAPVSRDWVYMQYARLIDPHPFKFITGVELP